MQICVQYFIITLTVFLYWHTKMAYKLNSIITRSLLTVARPFITYRIPLAQGPVSRAHEFANLSCFCAFASTLSVNKGDMYDTST